MTEPASPGTPPILLTPAPQAPLPSSRVLSYITSANTPTRLRNLTSRILLVIAMILLAIALLDFALLAYLVITFINVITAFAFRPVLMADLLEAAESPEWLLLLFILAYTFSSAVGFAICVKPVHRGSRGACYVARFALLPLLFILAFLAALATILAIMFGCPITQDRIRPIFFLLFLLTPALGFLLLLVIDLLGYLNWIAKNPVTEKPPVPFLSQRPAAPAIPKEAP